MEYYFIGIKGTGMSSLACMLKDLGNEVSGSDLEKHFFTEKGLVARNIPIYPFNPDNIHDAQYSGIAELIEINIESQQILQDDP